jgi:hypothetical protein
MTNWRERCAELLNGIELDVAHEGIENPDRFQALINRTRAELAQPEPEGPTDEELLQLAIDTRLYRFQATAGDPIQYEMTEQQVRAYGRAVWARAQAARPAIEPVPDTKVCELLNLLLGDLDALIDSSEGVAGLHLNGDVASWGSLRKGGRFETWLMRMDEARAFLDSTMDEPANTCPAIQPEERWYPSFADWLEREMPEGTVIGDPLWWASKIATYLQRLAIQPVPEPVVLTDEELDIVVIAIQRFAPHQPDGPTQPTHDLHAVDRGREILKQHLARYAPPAIKPVPVSERLPGTEDCDAEGRCWLLYIGSSLLNPSWVLAKPEKGALPRLFWLPHWALPVFTSQP